MIKNIITGLLLLSLSYSCTKDQGPVEPEVIITTVSYATDVQPIFNAQCTNCHNTVQGQFNGNLDLSEAVSYTNLVGVVSGYAPHKRVVSGDAESSVLWGKINNSGEFGSNMPLGGSLSNTEKETIKVWINEGALNN